MSASALMSNPPHRAVENTFRFQLMLGPWICRVYERYMCTTVLWIASCWALPRTLLNFSHFENAHTGDAVATVLNNVPDD